ncbi:MAG: outer membrane beta-barrel protein, partial [Thermoanaerobaculia bacterium]
MKRLSRWCICLCIVAVPLFAQIQTGNIYGKVQAKDGSALPGVTVVLTGVGAPQTFVSDSQGNFRFPNLSPGTYGLKAELAGYGSSVRQGINVSIGANADVTMMLNPSVAESITVTAEAPLLDVRKAGRGATVTRVELEKVPTGRDPWVILQQTPGVLIDRLNVGGSESGQQSSYVGKGQTSAQATWNIDGVNITDVGALGSSPTYYDFDSFEELQVTTGGTDPRIQTSGVQLNMVTKRGTNDFKGSARYLKVPGSMQADPKIPAEATNPADTLTHAGYLAKSNEINSVEDYGAEFGGPIMRDRLWLWGAYSKQQINLFTAQNAADVALGRFKDNTELKDYNAKLNAQILPSNSFAGSYTKGEKIKFGRSVGPTRLPDTAQNQNGPTDIWKLEDTQIIGSSFYLTGLISHAKNVFNLIPDNGRHCTTADCGLNNAPPYADPSLVYHTSFFTYETTRPQDQYRGDASSFFNTGSVSHELKFGFGYRKAAVSSFTAYTNTNELIFFNDTPGVPGSTGGVEMLRPTNLTYDVKSNDGYIGDTMMMGNLTLQAGLRYDDQKGSLRNGSTVANPIIPEILPAISFNGPALGSMKWTQVSPRIGLTYTIGNDKRTLLRAAANRYADQMGGQAVYGVAPTAYQYLYYYFTDLNGDKIAQHNEIDFDTGIVAQQGIDPAKSTVANNVYRWDPNIKNPHTDEILFGVEHELLTDFSVGATATYRRLSDFLVNRPEKHQGQGDYFTQADYELGGHVTGVLPDGTPYNQPYYQLKNGVVPIYRVVTNLPDYSQTYKGLELTATKRMSNRWMMRGNVSFNDWTQNVGQGAIWDPTRQRGQIPNDVAPGT